MTALDLQEVVFDGGISSYVHMGLVVLPFLIFILNVYLMVRGLVGRIRRGTPQPFQHLLIVSTLFLLGLSLFAFSRNLSLGLCSFLNEEPGTALAPMIIRNVGYYLWVLSLDIAMCTISAIGAVLLQGPGASDGVPNNTSEGIRRPADCAPKPSR